MWYKLSERTDMAIWITLAGLAVTFAVNIVFMPRYSYWASAFGHLASYLVMFIVSAWLGSKHYPIPYNWKRIGLLFVLMGAAYALMYFTAPSEPGIHWGSIALNTLLIGVYALMAWLIVRRNRQTEKIEIH
jgi:O-antigen/teichoic acid export membrane protein